MSKGAAVAVCEVFPRPPVSNCSASATSCHSNLFTRLPTGQGHKHRDGSEATGHLGGMAWLLRLLRNPEVLIGLVRWVRRKRRFLAALFAVGYGIKLDLR
jgi:hypothetical protein